MRESKGTTTPMPPPPHDPELLLRAVAVAKQWLGTDVVRRAVLDRHVGVLEDDDADHPRRRPGVWLAPLAPLDDAMHDRAALRRWLRDGLRGAVVYPRVFPLRWRDHYTALVVWRGPPVARRYHATLFDPHAGVPRRAHAAPPVHDVVEPALTHGRVPPDLRTVAPPEPSQREPADTLCVVWMTLYLCRKWAPGTGLRHAVEFLRGEVRALGRDFLRFCREEGVTDDPPRRLYAALDRLTVTAYRAAFHGDGGGDL